MRVVLKLVSADLSTFSPVFLQSNDGNPSRQLIITPLTHEAWLPPHSENDSGMSFHDLAMTSQLGLESDPFITSLGSIMGEVKLVTQKTSLSAHIQDSDVVCSCSFKMISFARNCYTNAACRI